MNKATKSKIDFGFNSEEFTGSVDIMPVAQFINPVRCSHWGIGIKYAQGQAAGFLPDDTWQLVDHEFSDDTIEKIYLCQTPRLVVLNRSGALMSDNTQIVSYDANKKGKGWKSFSYIVVWFLNKDNQPLSQIPFRLKCTGQAGVTFNKNYNHYYTQECFTKKFLQVYQDLTGDKTPKNQLFFTHAVYLPKLIKGKAVNKTSGQSSPACLTEGYCVPTPDNFASLIVKNGTKLSDRIKEALELTSGWINISNINKELEKVEKPISSSTPKPDRVEEMLEETSSLDAIPF